MIDTQPNVVSIPVPAINIKCWHFVQLAIESAYILEYFLQAYSGDTAVFNPIVLFIFQTIKLVDIKTYFTKVHVCKKNYLAKI